MRDIKFRAWDNLEMDYEPQISLISTASINDFFKEIEEGKIMQYTGLKDKNGKDIYEGDILKNKKGDISFIVFSNLGCFDVNSYYGGGYPWYTQINEIIGNIHQNKDLL